MTDLPDECGTCGNTTEVDLLRSLLDEAQRENEQLRKAVGRRFFVGVLKSEGYRIVRGEGLDSCFNIEEEL